MKLSISNIAWEREEDAAIVALLHNYGFTGIEVAPTKIHNPLNDISDKEIIDFKEQWKSKGIELVAMQSLLYGRSDLSIFGDQAIRKLTIDYLHDVFRIAGQLGTNKLVFGSPKNRQINDMDPKIAFNTAVDVFSELADLAVKHDVVLCIEPNPKEYGCDFINTVVEGLELVKAVNHNGFRLHVDTGGMILTGEDIALLLDQCFPFIQHFHISEPFLEMIGQHHRVHKQISEILKLNGYANWVSIEMKNNLKTDNVEAVREALELVSTIYND